MLPVPHECPAGQAHLYSHTAGYHAEPGESLVSPLPGPAYNSISLFSAPLKLLYTRNNTHNEVEHPAPCTSVSPNSPAWNKEKEGGGGEAPNPQLVIRKPKHKGGGGWKERSQFAKCWAAVRRTLAGRPRRYCILGPRSSD